jgi:mono/diheme cytochrome c family protein
MKKSLQKTLTVLGGVFIVAFLYGVLAIMLLPEGGLQEKREAEWKRATEVPSDPTVFPTVKGMMSPPVDLKAALAGSPKMAARGKELFQTNCASCHGPQGRGDGPAAAALNPKPRNFTSPDGWTNGTTIADIFRTLSTGVKGSAMVAYDTFPSEDRFALAHYVQSLGSFDHGRDSAEQIEALDKAFRLSTGAQEPNKVAVPKVMDHMAADYKSPAPLTMPEAADGSPGAELCRSMIRDPDRLAVVLAQMPGWRTDVDLLVRAAVASPAACGLDPGVVGMDRERWRLFHSELIARCPEPAAGGKTG